LEQESMSISGADTAQLRSTADQFTQAADQLQGTLRSIHGVVSNSSFWRGPDSEQFRTDWNSRSSASLNGAINTLREGALILRRNADEQEKASAVSTGRSPVANLSSLSTAPRGAAELYKRIHTLDDSYDGVRIEMVEASDHKTRFVVYLAGTDPTESKRDAGRNVSLATGTVDDATLQKIDDALRMVGYDPDDRSKQPEMMFVGFSQGGMEAQNIIASGRYNATALVTYGSPLTHADASGVSTVHLRAEGDNTPNLPAEALALVTRNPLHAALLRADLINGPGDRIPLLDPLSGESSTLFCSNPGVSPDWTGNAIDALLFGNHGQHAVYTDVGQDFDRSTDPRFTGQKTVMDKFQGTVVRSWAGDPSPTTESPAR